MRAYIGIDAGQSGAAVLLTPDNSFKIWDWSSEDRAYQVLYGWFQKYNVTAAIERVFNIMIDINKKNSKGRYFGNAKLAINYGIWRGLMTAIGIEYIEIAPVSWQSRVMLKSAGKTTKERSFNTVREIFPSTREHIKNITKDNGRADAFLIAYWLMKTKEIELKLKK